MASKLISAFTASGGYRYYPPYINVSAVDESPDSDVVVTIRGAEPECKEASITLKRGEWLALTRGE